MPASPVLAGDWYVAPGVPYGQGTGDINQPWNLQYALYHPAQVKAGDTIWMIGGVYTQPPDQVGELGVWRCELNGEPAAPIIVRAVPGARAILDGEYYTYNNPNNPPNQEVLAVLRVRARYVWFWGFEIIVSNPDRLHHENDSPRRPSGVLEGGNCGQGSGCKYINLVVHDCFLGIGLQQCPEEDTEVYGCIVFYNGEWEPARSTGLGIYTKQWIDPNQQPPPEPVTRLVRDNIVFSQYGIGLNSSDFETPGAVDNIHLIGNMSFNNGLLNHPDHFGQNIHIDNATTQVANNCQVLNNYTYYDPSVSACGGANELLDVASSQARGNYFVSEAHGCWSGCGGCERRAVVLWEAACDRNTLEFKNNVVYGLTDNSDPNCACRCSDTVAPYRDPPCSDCDNEFYDNLNPLPTEVRVFVRPNSYEAGRGNIVVYNWTEPPATEVNVDVSSILGQGDLYEVLDVQNYFGQPVATGVYLGGTINIPLPDEMAAVMQPIGEPVSDELRHTPREFNTFVLRRTGSFPHQNGPGFGE